MTTIAAPPSKSETHRAFLLAALSDRPCDVVDPLRADDPHATLACLAALGADWRPTSRGVRFEPRPLRPPARALPCGNSGTTLRLLAAQCARMPGAALLDGDASLRSRPQRDLHAALTPFGATVAGERAPVRVGGVLRPGAATLGPLAGSQALSGLLLALAQAPGPSRVTVAHPLPSRAYLDVTRASAAAFGLTWSVEEGAAATSWSVPGSQAPSASTVRVAGDWSSAATWLVAGPLLGRSVRVTGLDPRSPQADRRIIELVQAFGGSVRREHDGATAAPGDALRSPGAIDVAAAPDLFPVLAVLAAASGGTTTFNGVAGLRGKESDRAAAMVAGLHAMGIDARDDGSSVQVTGGVLRPARIDARGDHRVHMAFALAGLATAEPARHEVADPGCVRVSYPAFHDDLASLRGAV